ncbi:hypothetical protein [Herbiconiux sp. YIM B11900]|uniref:hypothetical protein n=1 Tax=Herbiconiux sp. YIM B11900 TaxID=3404131 RepID=UPI003F85C665
MSSVRDDLARVIRTGFFGLFDPDVDEEDLQIADAVLASDWFARVKREAGAASLEQAAQESVESEFSGDEILDLLRACAAKLR